jgi:hypothetical protein
MKILITGLVLAGVSLAFPVNATPLFYSDTQVVWPADTRYDPANPVAFNIPQFNPSLGTLTNVTLIVSGSAESTLNFTNWDGPTGGVMASETNALFVNYNSGTVAQNNFIWLTTGYPAVQQPGASGGVYSQSWGPETVAYMDNFTLAPDLANFTGMGNIPVSARFDVWFNLYATGGNNTWSVATLSTFTADVYYDYAPVPEPSSFGLMFGGLGLLAWMRRARRQSRVKPD